MKRSGMKIKYKKNKGLDSIFYNNKKQRAIKTCIFVILLIGLFLAGFFLYEPFSEFLKNADLFNQNKDDISLDNQNNQSTDNSDNDNEDKDENKDLDEDKDKDNIQTNEQTSTQEENTNPVEVKDSVTKVSFNNLQGAYFKHQVLSDDNSIDNLIQTVKSLGLNAVLIDLKDNLGLLKYNSTNQVAGDIGAVDRTAIDLSYAVQKLKENNITLIARLHMFRDSVASAKIENAAVMYGNANSGVKWLDNYAAQGGKPWLNPNSQEARDYLISILKEVTDIGVEHIVLDNVTFPNMGLVGDIYCGEYTSKQEVLESFLDEIDKEFDKISAKYTIVFPNRLYFEGDVNSFQVPIKDIALSVISPTIFPDQYQNNFTISGEVIENPKQNYFDTTTLIINQILANSPQGLEIMPFVSAINGVSKENINLQIQALSQTTVKSYILYNADGNYETLIR